MPSYGHVTAAAAASPECQPCRSARHFPTFRRSERQQSGRIELKLPSDLEFSKRPTRNFGWFFEVRLWRNVNPSYAGSQQEIPIRDFIVSPKHRHFCRNILGKVPTCPHPFDPFFAALVQKVSNHKKFDFDTFRYIQNYSINF